MVGGGSGVGSGGGGCRYSSRWDSGRSSPGCGTVGDRGDGPSTSYRRDVVVWAIHIFIRVRWVVWGRAKLIVLDTVATALRSGHRNGGLCGLGSLVAVR